MLFFVVLGSLVVLGNRLIGQANETLFGAGPFKRGWWLKLNSGDYAGVVFGGPLFICIGLAGFVAA